MTSEKQELCSHFFKLTGHVCIHALCREIHLMYSACQRSKVPTIYTIKRGIKVFFFFFLLASHDTRDSNVKENLQQKQRPRVEMLLWVDELFAICNL